MLYLFKVKAKFTKSQRIIFLLIISGSQSVPIARNIIGIYTYIYLFLCCCFVSIIYQQCLLFHVITITKSFYVLNPVNSPLRVGGTYKGRLVLCRIHDYA